MSVKVPTVQNPDPLVSTSFGISGLLDGIANLGLLYGASKIKHEFPEQFQTDQNYDPRYNQDNAVNDARYSQQSFNQQSNFTQYAMLGIIGLFAAGALVYMVRK